MIGGIFVVPLMKLCSKVETLAEATARREREGKNPFLLDQASEEWFWQYPAVQYTDGPFMSAFMPREWQPPQSPRVLSTEQVVEILRTRSVERTDLGPEFFDPHEASASSQV